VRQCCALVFDDRSGALVNAAGKKQAPRADWKNLHFEPALAGTGQARKTDENDWITEL